MKKLGFGTMRLPLLSEDQKNIDLKQVCRMADTFLENGFTYFDTAYMYHGGESERIFKSAVAKRHAREEYLLADKMPSFLMKCKEDNPRIFAEQLERTGAEYFDYYLIHSLDEKNYAAATEYECFEFAEKKKAEGLVKNLGFSFHDTAEVLEKILTERPDVDFVQLQINYLDWEDERVQSRKCYETCVRHGKKVVVMEPVKGGMLANLPANAERILKEYSPEMSAASWAIRFAASLENVMTVLSGMSDMGQMQDNISYMKDFRPLGEEEKKALSAALAEIRNFTVIPCTGCRYCTDGCPKKIPIPDYFSLYNEYERFNEKFYPTFRLGDLKKSGGVPADCVACGSCERHCPQHIGIINEMKKVAKAFDK